MQELFKIRTITYFIPTPCASVEEWAAKLKHAAGVLGKAQECFEAHGYEVQTVRIATRSLSTAADAPRTAAELEGIAKGLGIGFLNAGATSSLEHVAPGGAIAQLIKQTSFTSCSFAWQKGMGLAEAKQLAQLILGIAQDSDGASNFRFGVAFNCRDETPFFPVAHPGQRAGFAIGTENSRLLFEAMDQGAREGGGNALQAAHSKLREMMGAALAPVEALALKLEEETGEAYLGIDSSICPALERPNMAESYERVGLGRFGGPGSLAVSERLTAALKTLPLQRAAGYCGLMLPVCEDTGLAEAATEGRITVGGLLHLSSVCGCGIDTLPVPGPTADTPPEAREEMERRVAALLLDVAALAYRLDKPLSCRLLPVPGAAAGDPTRFNSPYLCASSVMHL